MDATAAYRNTWMLTDSYASKTAACSCVHSYNGQQMHMEAWRRHVDARRGKHMHMDASLFIGNAVSFMATCLPVSGNGLGMHVLAKHNF